MGGALPRRGGGVKGGGVERCGVGVGMPSPEIPDGIEAVLFRARVECAVDWPRERAAKLWAKMSPKERRDVVAYQEETLADYEVKRRRRARLEELIRLRDAPREP